MQDRPNLPILKNPFRYNPQIPPNQTGFVSRSRFSGLRLLRETLPVDFPHRPCCFVNLSRLGKEDWGVIVRYDLIVVGGGPAGQKAAIAAAKLQKRVALVTRHTSHRGGVGRQTATPSRTLKAAIEQLTGSRVRDGYGARASQKRPIAMSDLRRTLDLVAMAEVDIWRQSVASHQIDLHAGEARFLDPHTMSVCREGKSVRLEGERLLLAVGTKPARPPHIPFDGKVILDSQELLGLEQLPPSLIVVGGGVIGMEYAVLLATLGTEVTVVDGQRCLLDFCDREIMERLQSYARELGIGFRLGEDVVAISHVNPVKAAVELESGKRLTADSVLFTVGRIGDTASLNLAAAGLEVDERGRLWCDENFRTWVPHIYGVGDVIGFPDLANTSMEQGRRAAHAAFGQVQSGTTLLPYELFTIPEISMIGKNEKQLTAEKIPYEVGTCEFRELPPDRIGGDDRGLLKLLFHRESHQILGIHVIGETATEMIDLGQAVMVHRRTIEYFRDTVFHHPARAKAYKLAALNGLSKLAVKAQQGRMPGPLEEQILTDVHDLQTLCATSSRELVLTGE